ncbi:TetR/AcrR family transcriptional regulator [Aquihabitans sp. McL0605]|uniref:TetR/AcrR family transcriptional regulator n=1 Tax=Aquihabitans sp. McL0605 TaxID=3415671 RepID=UPI003CF825CF
MQQPRRRLSVDDRRDEVLRACLQLLGERPWDEVSMADVAAAAGASKPLLYHYFSTKSDLYLAAVRLAADELAEATKPDPSLPARARRTAALDAHLDWIEANDLAYRAVLQGGMSSHREVQAIVEASRDVVVRRLADEFGFDEMTPAQRIALRGWIGFLEGASLDWLRARDVSKEHLARLIGASVAGVIRAAKADPGPPAP